ncbi:hypothetical protein EW026_g3199 [Hermanssonia centrifuga]|uniref:Polyketide synthase-like phosphopantetheine-binding domain-containing protein n=1 Tax=Hermanssonia centrifuga TaxID=98765 RepID=A0A4S4KMX8_9APHY|nr:hypothetical protein EW026_g3199 [Hermanssonia centrifuga]
MGIGFQIIYPIVSGQSVSLFAPQYPAPPVVPHPQNTLEVCKLTCSTALTVVPSFLETWAHSDTAIEYLRTLQAICFGGGPLSPKAGDKLVAAGVKITTAYGGTEFGAPAYTFDEDGAQDSEIKPDADWSWLRFSKKPNLRWVPQGDGTYELQILTSEAFGLAVENLPDTRGYATSDLFVPHPTRKGLWRIVGRKDDVLVLSTGEKIVPLHQEEQITANPMIMGALMFGREREQAGILIEPNPEFAIDPTDEAALAAFRNKIWPSVEEANTPAPAFARIFKEMILVTDPSKPFPRAGKGTVIRNQATALYADAIDKLSDSEGIPPPTSWSTGDIEHWIVKLAASVNDGRIPSSSQSLFEQGFDSLSATFMRNRILGVLRSAEDPSLQKAVSKISPNIVFEHPSVRELATALAGIVDPTSDTSLAPGKIAADAVALVEKYTANLPVQTGQSQSTDGVVVLLTGSTGNIGSHILAALLADNRISKVYTLNRASSTSEDRLATAFRDRDLPVALLSHPKLRSLAGDLSQDNFGLEQSIYTEIINSATHIVHNAWTVNFNHPLSAFEKQIAGVRRVVDICASSPRPVRLLFTSSVGAAGGWRADDGLVPEKPLPNPEIAALNGYAASKYVVEQILSKAAENGLNMVSLRMGQACGSRETGAWGTTEWMPILVKSSIALGCLPDIDGLVSWVPLDAIGGLYIDLLLSEQALPQLMNVVHPRPTQWKNVLAAIGEELGGHLPFVPLDAWVHKLEAYASEPSKQDLDNIPAIKLLTFFRGMATTSTSDKVAANVEAGGMPMFETIQLQRSSLTMRQIPSLDDENAKVWPGE